MVQPYKILSFEQQSACSEELAPAALQLLQQQQAHLQLLFFYREINSSCCRPMCY
jgi:hypothetical protein